MPGFNIQYPVGKELYKITQLTFQVLIIPNTKKDLYKALEYANAYSSFFRSFSSFSLKRISSISFHSRVNASQ